MRVLINASRVHGGLTPAMQAFLEKELADLEEYLAPDSAVSVSVVPDGPRAIAVNASMVLKDNYHVRRSKTSEDFYIAAHTIYKGLEEAAKKHLNERTDKRQSGGSSSVDAIEPALIDRRKTIIASPMSETEAIEQAEALGHSWFAFRNTDLPGTPLSLLYSRVVGGWGIAELR